MYKACQDCSVKYDLWWKKVEDQRKIHPLPLTLLLPESMEGSGMVRSALASWDGVAL